MTKPMRDFRALVKKSSNADLSRAMIGFAADGGGGRRQDQRRVWREVGRAHRTAQRNGYRDRDWQTRLGQVDMKILRLKTGTYSPAFIAFAQPDHQAAKTQWRVVADQMRGKLPKLAAFSDTAKEDVLAYMTFPAQHRTKLHSTNLIERLNGEI